ncbi:hypothetical protein [Streptomyces cylindrosporus]|uniref:Uncharacterized protein n=1 Tax=Streptomyces cylindrosporus TaxID=2927583 RepID=A0ABS9YJY6_9ACTN|nr:hypothetical protein [Streptomyces cylindrosporus]MCI3277244.1 hypothetical protein [Streptomyces cylindrosporus]
MQDRAEAGPVDPDEDDRAFDNGRSLISWSGHGTVTGMGSWRWAIPVTSAAPDAVQALPAFLPSPDEVVCMTDVNGAIPATRSAITRTGRFTVSGPERMRTEQLQNGTARPRPGTPAHAAVTDAFSRPQQRIVLARAPVGAELDRAVEAIDEDLAAHRYYPPTGR